MITANLIQALDPKGQDAGSILKAGNLPVGEVDLASFLPLLKAALLEAEPGAAVGGGGVPKEAPDMADFPSFLRESLAEEPAEDEPAAEGEEMASPDLYGVPGLPVLRAVPQVPQNEPREKSPSGEPRGGMEPGRAAPEEPGAAAPGNSRPPSQGHVEPRTQARQDDLEALSVKAAAPKAAEAPEPQASRRQTPGKTRTGVEALAIQPDEASGSYEKAERPLSPEPASREILTAMRSHLAPKAGLEPRPEEGPRGILQGLGQTPAETAARVQVPAGTSPSVSLPDRPEAAPAAPEPGGDLEGPRITALRVFRRLGDTTVNLRLVSDRLGDLRLEVLSAREGIEATLSAQDPGSRRLLLGSLGILRSSLEEAGINLRQLEVREPASSHLGDADSGAQQPDDRGEGSRRSWPDAYTGGRQVASRNRGTPRGGTEEQYGDPWWSGFSARA